MVDEPEADDISKRHARLQKDQRENMADPDLVAALGPLLVPIQAAWLGVPPEIRRRLLEELLDAMALVVPFAETLREVPNIDQWYGLGPAVMRLALVAKSYGLDEQASFLTALEVAFPDLTWFVAETRILAELITSK